MDYNHSVASGESSYPYPLNVRLPPGEKTQIPGPLQMHLPGRELFQLAGFQLNAHRSLRKGVFVLVGGILIDTLSIMREKIANLK
jgi:hypothetical protein